MTAARAAGDVAACRKLLREGSRSFHAASLLLPPQVRDDASAVYAWCRVGDHAVDRGPDPSAALISVRSGLERAYGGSPEGPVERAFASVVARNAIPRSVPETMLEGFQWDVEGRTYDDDAQTLDYCVRVGSTVGVMMTLLMERADAATLRDACRLGMAMQLTNIARDVGEDARVGRLYLPLAWLRQEEVEIDAWLGDPSPARGVLAVVRRILAYADALYAAAWPGIERLPARCRPAIRAAALVYANIGRKVREAGYDSVSSRAWTTRPEKLRLLAAAALARPGAWSRDPEAGDAGVVALADARADFLVDAVYEVDI